MRLDKHIPASHIEIWQPRWHDRKVLIAKHKVATHNKIVFTKSPTMKGEYYASKDTITKYPTESNGKIECYAVPVGELEILE